MKIDGAIPCGQPVPMGGAELRTTSSPADHASFEEQYIPREMPARRVPLLRGTLRHQALQNAPVARANTTPPGPNFSDSQLAGELGKHFGELHAFLTQGRLTPSSLRRFAAEKLEGE